MQNFYQGTVTVKLYSLIAAIDVYDNFQYVEPSW